jgi:glycosyltransferase involved in cell wall biosynthesis
MKTRGKPAVSILICTYNRLHYLRQALSSAFSQTFDDLEVIVIDDGSTDGTENWVRRRNDPRLRYFRYRRNRGVAAARNEAWRAANGRFLAYLDSDDLWSPLYLKTVLPAFDDPTIQVATTNTRIIDSRGRTLRAVTFPPGLVGSAAFKIAAGLDYAPCTSATVFRRSLARRLHGFDERFLMNEDFDFFLRAGHLWGPQAFRFFGAPLVAHRRHGRQLTGVSYWDWKDRRNLRAWLPRWNTFTRQEKDNIWDQLFLYKKHSETLAMVSQGFGQ